MKNLKFIVLALAMAALMGTGLAWSPTAQAIALSNTAVTGGGFWDFAGMPLLLPTYSLYDFEPTPPGPDGSIWSAAFTGIGDAAGLYVYMYQLSHFPVGESSERGVSGMAVDFMTNPAFTPVDGGMTSYYISDNGGVVPSSVTWADGVLRVTFDDPTIPRDGYSVFGTFSRLPPTLAVADIRDTGETLISPEVITPVPEPASMMLLGSGLVGVAAFARRKWLARK